METVVARRRTDEWRDFGDLTELLEQYLEGDGMAWDTVNCEVPFLRYLPQEWEEPILRAADDPRAEGAWHFLSTFAEILIKLPVLSDRLPHLLIRCVEIGPGYRTFTFVANYVERLGHGPEDALAQAVVRGHDQLPGWRKLVVWLDGPCRNLVKLCRKQLERR